MATPTSTAFTELSTEEQLQRTGLEVTPENVQRQSEFFKRFQAGETGQQNIFPGFQEPTAPTVESSDLARETTDRNIGELDDISAQRDQQITTPTEPSRDTTLDDIRDGVLDESEAAQRERERLIGEFSLNEFAAEQLRQDPATVALLQEFNNNVSADKAEIDALKSRIASGIIDPETQALVAGIENTFGRRIEAQIELNKRVIAGTNVRGFRSGRTRFASEVQTGILGDVERKALQAINALESERDQLIAQAKAAQGADDFAKLDRLMGDFRSTNERRLTALINFNQEANKQLDTILEQRRAEEQAFQEESDIFAREANILNLVGQGITDPIQLFDSINFDEQGNKIGDVSLEEITDLLDQSVQESVGKSLSGVNREFFQAKEQGFIPEDMTLFEFIQSKATAKRKPTGGGDSTGFTGTPDSSVGSGDAVLKQDGSIMTFEEFLGRKAIEFLGGKPSLSEIARETKELITDSSERNKLQAEYNQLVGLAESGQRSGDTSGFSKTDLKKLEQAKLLNAPRQEMLDFLFGEGGGSGGNNLDSKIDEILEGL